MTFRKAYARGARQRTLFRVSMHLFPIVISTFVLFASARRAHAQGCIIARSGQQITGPESQGGYIAPKHWQVTVDYRHQFSFRHFVGPVEQEYRFQLGNQVENKINLFDFQLSYQATQRWSFGVGAPMLFATRRANNSPYTESSQGQGDIAFTAQTWLWKPANAARGNIQVGFGVQAPTGLSNIKSVVNKDNGQGNVTVSNDYSIQPGIGGWGIVLEGQGFKALGSRAVFYADGSYLITPQNTNNTPTGQTLPLLQYVSISDEYLAEAEVAIPMLQVSGLALTFGPRIEGVPAHDLIGSEDGFRRPGFAISIVPGVQWVHHKSIWSFQMGRAFYRDRTRSYPDEVYGTHGDAAFADYLWLASYTYRF